MNEGNDLRAQRNKLSKQVGHADGTGEEGPLQAGGGRGGEGRK